MRRPGSALVPPLLALTLPVLGCAGTSPLPGERGTVPRSAASAPAAGDDGAELRALTEREQVLVQQLERDVVYLATEIGERSSAELWNQAGATDYLVEQLEAAGHSVQRQGYSLEGNETAQNLEVQVDGGAIGDEVLVVGAHYDSAIGSPGADDNASGVAALLALSRSLRQVEPARTLRLVAFANQEAPFGKTEHMGSRVYAKQAMARGDKIVGVIAVESIGYFSDQPDSQQRPGAMRLRFSDAGNFIAVVGDEGSSGFAEAVLSSFVRHASLPVEGGGFPNEVAEMGGADHWAFWQMHVPAVMVTDTGALRNPHHHQPTDTPDQLDFGRMARVVAALEQVVVEIVEASRRPE